MLLIQVALFALTGNVEMSVLKMLLPGNSEQLVPGRGCAEALKGLAVKTARPARQPTARQARTRFLLVDTNCENVSLPIILPLAPIQRAGPAARSPDGQGLLLT